MLLAPIRRDLPIKLAFDVDGNSTGDLQIDSADNLPLPLPPALPIANPGLASLRAAAAPASTNYLLTTIRREARRLTRLLIEQSRAQNRTVEIYHAVVSVTALSAALGEEYARGTAPSPASNHLLSANCPTANCQTVSQPLHPSSNPLTFSPLGPFLKLPAKTKRTSSFVSQNPVQELESDPSAAMRARGSKRQSGNARRHPTA